MGTSVLLHISLRDLESGRFVSLLGLTQPCEDYVHRSKKKGGENHLRSPQRQRQALGIPRGCCQMRSAEHCRSPNRVSSLPHTLPASPTAYNEHRINRADLWRQPRGAPSFTEGLGTTGTLRYREGREGAALPQPGPAEGHRDPRPSPRLSAGHSPGVCEPRSWATRARIAPGPGPG